MEYVMKIAAILGLAAAFSLSSCARAADRDVSCTLKFSSTQWSVLYEHAEGTGTVTCDNGKKMEVDISAKGVGLTAGKWRIDRATGKFTHVAKLRDVLGNYAALSANVGLVKSGTVQALTNGKVSLVLAGSGDGFDVGVTISQFKIERSAIDPST
jgi:hypothetical protein